MFYDALLLN